SFGSRRPRRLWRERAPARPPGARLGRHGPPARPPVRAGAGGRRAGGLPGEQPRSGAVRGPPRSRRRSPRGTAHGRLVGRPRRRARRRAARGAPAGRRARRGAAEHCGARGVEGVCPTRDGGRRLLHAERHRHESQGGRDQGVSRRRALCCSPSTCSRGADMRRQDVSVCGLRGPSQGPRAVARDDGGRCESRSRGWGPAYWASTARASTTSGRALVLGVSRACPPLPGDFGRT
ncbi:unnamed protein product, partial [Prorocentrum cordatum]